MDKLRIFGEIAGIGGFAILFISQVFKIVTKRFNYSKLDKNQTYKVVNKIMLYSFIITFLGIISYTLTYFSDSTSSKNIEVKTKGNNSPAIYSPNGNPSINYSITDTSLNLKDSI